MSGIYATFFGADGTQKLSLSTFVNFLNRLHLELVRLEFSFYDENNTVRNKQAMVISPAQMAGTLRNTACHALLADAQ